MNARWAAAMALVAATTLLPAGASAQTPTPVRTVPIVDLNRYAGDWFEIARFPNRFQRQCVGAVRATYARRADGRVDVVNRCRTAEGETEARGVARIVDQKTSADGASAAIKYLTGYVIEKSLSVDNVFVIAMIFAFMAVRASTRIACCSGASSARS